MISTFLALISSRQLCMASLVLVVSLSSRKIECLGKISVNLFKEFEKFEPFGLGNPKPIFLTSNIKLISHRLVGKENKHLQLRFSDGISETKAVVFNHCIDLKKLISGENYNIVYQPGLNFWNGKNWIDLRLLDIKNSEGASPQI